jgi:hypothetical protein
MAEQKRASSGAGVDDVAEHMRAWRGFVRVVKWSLIFILVIMGFLAIFRVH